MYPVSPVLGRSHNWYIACKPLRCSDGQPSSSSSSRTALFASCKRAAATRVPQDPGLGLHMDSLSSQAPGGPVQKGGFCIVPQADDTHVGRVQSARVPGTMSGYYGGSLWIHCGQDGTKGWTFGHLDIAAFAPAHLSIPTSFLIIPRPLFRRRGASCRPPPPGPLGPPQAHNKSAVPPRGVERRGSREAPEEGPLRHG